MEELELMYFCDQIERIGELAEIAEEDEGLTLDSLNFANFWANVDEVTV